MMGVGRRSVAFVSGEMVGPTFAAMASGVEEVTTAGGHLLLLCTTHSSVQRERETIYSLREQRAAAVLLVGSTPVGEEFEARIAEYADALEMVGARLILCGRPPLASLPHVASLDYDHVGGVRAAVAHLVELGHRRIGYIDLDEESSTPLQRFRGYREGLAAAGLDVDERIVLRTANDIESAEATIAEFPLIDEGITALVCVTDLVAVGARNGLRRRGLDVPGDVSVVGFDDMLLVADLTPPLTTVRAPFHELGALAGRIALGQTAFEGAIELPTELVVRGSTAQPASR
ncbi:MAG TPA: substrate-binding domain-containing protein [Microbacterium sp.]|uniref:LacI family DNA-binding transcriptional regulator n=1 Tax=Microbacterium sp. TaxID=51671 RepID=UPI002BFA1557|nr:substrate-binding domain-containing protein [Microbacterium sp.]HWI30085.1 substrate-binding domain-containing protein [Microbacterium sp.]